MKRRRGLRAGNGGENEGTRQRRVCERVGTCIYGWKKRTRRGKWVASCDEAERDGKEGELGFVEND